MATSMGTITIPITATLFGKAYHIGDLTLEVKLINGRVAKAPTERDIKAALRKARF